jgi:hypothetical protein
MAQDNSATVQAVFDTEWGIERMLSCECTEYGTGAQRCEHSGGDDVEVVTQ